MRALLLLVSLGLLAVAAIPVVGDLAGVRLMGSLGTSSPGTSSPEGPRVLLDNNFMVALFWAFGWITLALLCAAAALGLDQQKRLLRLYRQLDRRLEQPPVHKPAQQQRPQAARQAPEPPRPAAKRRFEPRLAAPAQSASKPAAKAAPAPELEPETDWQAVLDDDPPLRGPVLRADR